MKKYFLEVIVFISGAVVMVLELIGSRIIAPFLGSSLPVWTAIIGVILGSLGFGYLIGGRMADRKTSQLILATLLFGAGILIGILAFIDELVLVSVQLLSGDLRISALVSSIILLAPASIVLGAVSPYAIRLRITDIATSGSTVGTLYALSTFGSIAGTFLAGFFLIAYLGTFKIIISLALTMFLISFLADRKNYFPVRVAVITLMFLVLAGLMNSKVFNEKNGFIDIDTDYSRIWIYDDHDPPSGRLIRRLVVNGENDSSVFLPTEVASVSSRDDLVQEYTKFYRLVGYFRPDTAHALMIGGGAYTYPGDYINSFPKATIDVVEIDPGITDIARKYFGLADDPRMAIFHEDGRTFLNKTDKQYDVVFMDAYRSFSVPFHLTTREAVEKMYGHLDENGVVFANLISSITGDTGKFLRAEYATFKDVFPYVYVFLVETDGSVLQNIMLVAAKSAPTALGVGSRRGEGPNEVGTPQKAGNSVGFKSKNTELQKYLNHLWKEPILLDMPILTDDYAPVEQYIKVR